jgi:hypothetical protein
MAAPSSSTVVAPLLHIFDVPKVNGLRSLVVVNKLCHHIDMLQVGTLEFTKRKGVGFPVGV